MDLQDLFKFGEHPVEGLPPNFHYLGDDCRPSDGELDVFPHIRAAFGLDESTFKDAAKSILAKAITDSKVSTAKSGAMMAFEGDLMVKSMSEEEVTALFSILRNYLAHVTDDANSPKEGARQNGTLLPRFLGMYIYKKSGMGCWLEGRTVFFIQQNVFGGVPPDVMGSMVKYDLKGSADDRKQRRPDSEYMGFDLLAADQKFVPADDQHYEEFSEQLTRDVNFLLAQHMPRAPLGLVDYDAMPEQYRGKPGFMDYSMILGVVSRGTPGGCHRMDVVIEKTVAKGSRDASDPHLYEVKKEEATLLLGVVDVLQFWTPKKRIARRFKKLMKLEHDEGEYRGDLLDTVPPRVYGLRFLKFMKEVFRAGSWLESLPVLHDHRWKKVPMIRIHHLPEAQRRDAETARAAEDDVVADSPTEKEIKDLSWDEYVTSLKELSTFRP
eukprot:TRINITY_DN114047_c0_g1_i1.p1 TRINITY_DN114047_c0_g1~~TRINITY_DN114047_c0_g1_i1.p1  ORF type:complete len:467 (-),score=89.86 TRINITY_DN114047_c0_g1_i1:214-1527(-)